jgi:hypothetical protein
MPSTKPAAPPATLLPLLVGAWVSQAIYVAAKLGIADFLAEGPRTTAELAGSAQVNEGALYRVLRALASLEIFEECDGGRFALTPLAECLRSDVPGSLRAFAVMLGEPEHRRAWDDVLHSVRTGEPAFDHIFGVPHFQYFSANAAAAQIFNEGMASRASVENDAIVAAYDFSKSSTVVDVGGGQGTLLAEMLREAPQLSGVLFDLPHVIAAKRSKAQENKEPRLQFREGNFFESVPPGGDLYVLKKIIHDWDDVRATSILRNCAAAMSDKARLLVIDPVIPPGNEHSFNKLLDLMMLVWTSGGRERTEREHRALLGKAGLETLRVIETNVPLLILETAVH